MFLASIACHRCDRTVFLAEHGGLAETSPEGESMVIIAGNGPQGQEHRWYKLE